MFSTYNHFEISVSILQWLQNLPLLLWDSTLIQMHSIRRSIYWQRNNKLMRTDLKDTNDLTVNVRLRPLIKLFSKSQPGADWHFFLWGGVMALKGPVGRGQARGATWYLMCYHARTKKCGKGYLFSS